MLGHLQFLFIPLASMDDLTRNLFIIQHLRQTSKVGRIHDTRQVFRFQWVLSVKFLQLHFQRVNLSEVQHIGIEFNAIRLEPIRPKYVLETLTNLGAKSFVVIT